MTDDNSDKSHTIISSFYHLLLSIPVLTRVSIYNLLLYLSWTFPFLSKVWDVSPCPTSSLQLSKLALLSTGNILHIRLKIVLKCQSVLQTMSVNIKHVPKSIGVINILAHFCWFLLPGAQILVIQCCGRTPSGSGPRPNPESLIIFIISFGFRLARHSPLDSGYLLL